MFGPTVNHINTLNKHNIKSITNLETLSMMLGPTAGSGEIEGTSRPPADATVRVAGSLRQIFKDNKGEKMQRKKDENDLQEHERNSRFIWRKISPSRKVFYAWGSRTRSCHVC